MSKESKYLLVRSFDKLDYAEDFVNGHIRMLSLDHYRHMEDDGHGRKDPMEGVQLHWLGEHLTIDIDGFSFPGAGNVKAITMGIDDYAQKTKISCYTLLPLCGSRYSWKECISSVELPYCVLFSNPHAFIERFQYAAITMEPKNGRVSYFDPDSWNGSVNCFMKSKCFEKQSEYRLALQSTDHDPFILDIGSIRDIAQVFLTEDLISKLEQALKD